MVARGASLGPPGDELKTEAPGDPGPVPNKRSKIQAPATELGGKDAEDEKQQRGMSAAARGEGTNSSPAGPISTPSPRLPFLPHPGSGKTKDLRSWDGECRRIGKILPKDPRNNLPTRKERKNQQTTDAVQSPEDKVIIHGVARSIVSVSSTTHGRINLIAREGTLLDPVPKLSVGLPNMTIFNGELMFFSDYYDIALLEIDVDFPLLPPSIGPGPNYGQEVFVLARDDELSLMARRGEILWLEKPNYLDRNYHMFLGCEVPWCGNGGPVIDCIGNVIGVAFCCSPDPAVLSISTIVTCIDMWLKFSRIARPIHGLGIRTMEMLDVSLLEEIYRDHNISSGFIVDTVSCDSAAESLGILPGDVIVSLDERHALTLPQLEDYFLSLGWAFLKNSCCMVDIKLEVYDLIKKNKRSITLPLGFHDA